MLFLYLNLFDACDKYQTFSLCTYFCNIPEFLLSYFLYNGSKWSNIFHQYDGNCVLRDYLNFVHVEEQKSATIPKQIQEFLKNNKQK